MTTLTRAELNRLHRATDNPLFSHDMRQVAERKVAEREAKHRQERHSLAVAHTVDCQNKADRYFARLNGRIVR